MTDDSFTTYRPANIHADNEGTYRVCHKDGDSWVQPATDFERKNGLSGRIANSIYAYPALTIGEATAAAKKLYHYAKV